MYSKCRYSQTYDVKIAWYGHNTSYCYGETPIQWGDDGDVVVYQVDEDAWRTSEHHEDSITNEYYYFEVGSFEWYTIIETPVDMHSERLSSDVI